MKDLVKLFGFLCMFNYSACMRETEMLPNDRSFDKQNVFVCVMTDYTKGLSHIKALKLHAAHELPAVDSLDIIDDSNLEHVKKITCSMVNVALDSQAMIDKKKGKFANAKSLLERTMPNFFTKYANSDQMIVVSCVDLFLDFEQKEQLKVIYTVKRLLSAVSRYRNAIAKTSVDQTYSSQEIVKTCYNQLLDSNVRDDRVFVFKQVIKGLMPGFMPVILPFVNLGVDLFLNQKKLSRFRQRLASSRHVQVFFQIFNISSQYMGSNENIRNIAELNSQLVNCSLKKDSSLVDPLLVIMQGLQLWFDNQLKINEKGLGNIVEVISYLTFFFCLNEHKRESVAKQVENTCKEMQVIRLCRSVNTSSAEVYEFYHAQRNSAFIRCVRNCSIIVGFSGLCWLYIDVFSWQGLTTFATSAYLLLLNLRNFYKKF